ncbi:MAG: hypothetical protein H6Q65_564 [Firmicutes bacterium]|nr:hypothetical protein [Bacillota bacterium]
MQYCSYCGKKFLLLFGSVNGVLKTIVLTALVAFIIITMPCVSAEDERWIKAGEDKFGVYYVEKQSVKPMMDEQGLYLDVWFKNEHTTAGLEDLLNNMTPNPDDETVNLVYNMNYTVSHEKIRVSNWTHMKLKAVIYDRNNASVLNKEISNPTWVGFKPKSPVDMVAQQALIIVIEREQNNT